MTLDATPAGSAANSYCTVAEADAYFNTSFNRPVWGATSTPNKEIALIEAVRLLDSQVKWYGYLATNTQVLRWPRAYVPSPDSYPSHRSNMDSGLGGPYAIPQPVKELACELAYHILSNLGYSSSENDLTRIKVGPILLDFSEKVKNQGFPQVVRDMISRWGEYSVGSSNEVRSVGLVRT